MLQYETARRLYEAMRDRSARSSISGFQNFYQLFLKSAGDYAATRTAWAAMDQAARNADDKARRIKHDAFLSALGAVARNLEMPEVETLLPDRKTKGDFACYVALFLALEQR